MADRVPMSPKSTTRCAMEGEEDDDDEVAAKLFAARFLHLLLLSVSIIGVSNALVPHGELGLGLRCLMV